MALPYVDVANNAVELSCHCNRLPMGARAYPLTTELEPNPPNMYASSRVTNEDEKQDGVGKVCELSVHTFRSTLSNVQV